MTSDPTPQQTPLPIVNFGATIVEKRVPFSDAAVRNRTIMIKTVRREGDYREVSEVDIDNAGLRSVADHVRQNKISMPVSDRVMECWRPLMEIAATLGDFDWVIHLDAEYQKARKMLAVGDQYESEDILIKAVVGIGDMMGDGLHHEPDGKWIVREYNQTPKALGMAPKRKNNSPAINQAVSEALKTTQCSKCGGELKQTRSGSFTVKCTLCKSKFKFKRGRNKTTR